MEAELEHELTALIQQDEADEEQERSVSEVTADQQQHTSKQHDTAQEHRDSLHHDTSHDMLFPSLLSTPTRHFHRTSPSAFLSPPVRQLPSPTQLHSLLLMTEGRLREREQQVQMAAEVGEALLRQQEEREEEARQLRQRAEDAEYEVERVRTDMDRLQERNITLLTQLREAESTTHDQQKRTAEAEGQLALLTTQLTRERERRRGEERAQHSTSTSLVTDNANLTTTLATLHTQLTSYQHRITLLTQQHETQRTTTAHYKQEAEAWERLVEERERKAKEREDELLEEIDSLSYRCRQLQEAVPMCGPSVVGGGGSGLSEFDGGLGVVVEGGESNEKVKEVREVGRNQRLSMMPYESLLAELEGELQAEIAARQTRAIVDETDKENVNREANNVKEERAERMTAEHMSDEKLKAVTAITQVPVASIVVSDTVTQCTTAITNTVATSLVNCSTLASPTTTSSSTSTPPSPPSPSSSVDVLKEYFHLATLSVKLSSVESNVSACNINVNELYARVIRDDVAFHRWHAWIEARMREVRPVGVGVAGGGAGGKGGVGGRSSPGQAAEREREKVSEKVLYAHGSSVSVSMKQRPQAATAAAKKATSTGGGLLSMMSRRGWGRG